MLADGNGGGADGHGHDWDPVAGAQLSGARTGRRRCARAPLAPLRFAACLPGAAGRDSPLLQATPAGRRMADFDEIYEEEEDEERALEEQLLKYSPDPVVVRGSGHVTV